MILKTLEKKLGKVIKTPLNGPLTFRQYMPLSKVIKNYLSNQTPRNKRPNSVTGTSVVRMLHGLGSN